MNASTGLIAFIKSQEGFVRHAYLDPPHNTRGLYSTGYGHQIQPNEKALLTKILTEPEASLMLTADLRYYVNETNRALKREVSQPQFDAFVDLAYNAGVGSMQKVVATWNATGSAADTVAHLKQYVHADGVVNQNLVNRRNHEANWFTGTLNEIETQVEKKSTT